MQQAQTEQPETFTVEALAKEIFEIDDSYDTEEISADGTKVVYTGSSFNYELSEMYRSAEVTRNGEYGVSVPHAGDDGSSNDVTIETIQFGEQSGVVVYDIYQPPMYSDEDYVCSGSLTLILTNAENHEAVVKDLVEKARNDAKTTTVSLAVDLLKSVANDKPEDLAAMMKEAMLAVVKDARYVFDKNADDVISLGNVDAARTLYEAGRETGKVLDRSWAGAYIAELLHKHPLVESFSLDFSTSQEYDDHDYYTSHNLSLFGLEFVNDVPSVVMEDMEGEEYDADRYLDLLDDQIKMQDSAEYELYEGFCGVDAEDNFKVTVTRSALKDLLEQDVIDGLAVSKVIMQSIEEE